MAQISLESLRDYSHSGVNNTGKEGTTPLPLNNSRFDNHTGGDNRWRIIVPVAFAVLTVGLFFATHPDVLESLSQIIPK